MKMVLSETANVGEVRTFLLFHLESANADKSRINPSFSREDMWNLFMKSVFGRPDEDSMDSLAIRNITREFGSWYETE